MINLDNLLSRQPAKTCLLIFTVFIGLSCARSINPDINRGSTYKYRAGYPEVRFSAVAFLNEKTQPTINIAADIVYESLIFKQIGETQKANLSVRIDLNSKNNSVAIDSKNYEIDIDRDSLGSSLGYESYLFEKTIEVPAGSYVVNLTTIDQNSGKKTIRKTKLSIPNPDSDVMDLTNIRMLGKNSEADSSWHPITTYDVQGKIDSLMFIIQVTNNLATNPLSVNAKLVRIEADTSVARPMFYNNYTPATIEYQGVNYDDKTLLQESNRKLLENGSVFIEFYFENFERGNYRFEVTVPQNENELFKARDFSVKSQNYPALKSSRELAQPLIYLMGENNYKDMMDIQNPDSLKQAIDNFWLKEIGDKIEASQVLEKYYTRVEEANKQFSNFKEGWKTDAGMIYILFGPPWYVQNTFGEMEWNYSYNREDPNRTFFFEEPKINTEFFPFNHFVLLRNAAYSSLEYQQRQLWLSGLILERDL